jgi:hypothetical protein
METLVSTPVLSKGQKAAATRAANKAKNLAAKEQTVESTATIIEAPKMSAGMAKTVARVAELTAKKEREGLTVQELTWLANAEEKMECKTLSRVYRELELKFKAKNQTIVELIGKSAFPTFKLWADKMPVKAAYSYYDGLQVIAKFNKAAALKTKVVRQNKAEAKK